MIASLSARLLIAVSLVLAVFFGATVIVLDNAFRNTAERAVEDRLDVQIFLLLAEAEPVAAGQLELPDSLPEPRFSTPGSGLYGQIYGPAGDVVWRSKSTVGIVLPMQPAAALGQHVFTLITLEDGQDVFLHTLNVEWEFENGSTARYQFGVAESREPYLAQVRRFRRQMYGWFAGLAIALVLTLGLLLRWVLSPLRLIEREIHEVETGRASELSDDYPSELLGLTRNTNHLIAAERSRLERYRNTLGNLAHALKTPLAVIRGNISAQPRDDVELEQQIKRIDDIISYQLNRAAASGGVTLGNRPVALTQVIPGLKRSLDKVYADKAPVCSINVDEEAIFYGDEGDLTEIVGNLMDNAYKYCRSNVAVTALPTEPKSATRRGLLLHIDDDGPGIDPRNAEALMQRGARADEQADGHGIGLAVVREIVQIAGGQIQISNSSLGGTRVTVCFASL